MWRPWILLHRVRERARLRESILILIITTDAADVNAVIVGMTGGGANLVTT